MSYRTTKHGFSRSFGYKRPTETAVASPEAIRDAEPVEMFEAQPLVSLPEKPMSWWERFVRWMSRVARAVVGFVWRRKDS